MGTSSGYTPAGGPQWGAAKGDAANAVNPQKSGSEKLPQALQSHLAARLGGTGQTSGGGGVSGAAGTHGGGGGRRSAGGGTAFRVARATAQGLGQFISEVQTDGLREALVSRGLDSLADRPLQEVIQGIVSTLTERTGYIEEADALTAAGKVLDDLRTGCDTLDEFEQRLDKLTDSARMSCLLSEFFRHVLVEDFMRHYWRHLQEKCSNGRLEELRKQLDDLLFEKLQFDLDYGELGEVEWSSDEAQALIERVERETFELCCEVVS